MTDPQGTDKRRVALIFGGRSCEHEVSIVSARSVDRALDREKFEVVPMAIDRRGLWADADTARRVLAESSDRADDVARFEGHDALDPRLLEGAIDVAFPVLHGPYGEDGTIQGLFEMLDLPYVGCD
ncbi:MAG: D-alanine--D-alanine ligase A, partial [Thermoanaerobaculales bacterium]|nr:D-alanine--D-alanine ligase A [Thermoanaerobaculales bacterium]